MKTKISLTINGKPYHDEVEPRLLLIHDRMHGRGLDVRGASRRPGCQIA